MTCQVAKNVYCPSMTMGVNTKICPAGCKGIYKRICSLLKSRRLSQWGIPVTIRQLFLKASGKSIQRLCGKRGFRWNNRCRSGMSFTLEISWPPQEDFEKLKGWITSLDAPSVADKTIKEAIMEEAANCLNGTSTVDVCAGKIMQKVNLYLSE